MGRENIEKYSKLYALTKAIAGFWHNNIFYRRVIVLGRDNIDPNKNLIFAPNHQNALMDALAVLFTHKGQPVFLARADIFRKKTIASLLYFLKILPVYRIRDGFSSVKSNDKIFLKTIDVIRNKSGLVILPEGNHEGMRRLRQLKKGICRIAFQAEEASDFKLNIQIIPVGLEFTHYTRYRQVLTVVYGKPIEVSDLHELYRKNPEIAYNELRSILSARIKRLMVHIESDDDYEAIDELRTMVNGRFSDDIRFPKLFRDRMLIEKLNRLKESMPDMYARICSLSLLVKEKAKKFKLDYRVLEKRNHPLGWLIAGIAGLIITFPVFLFGNIFTLTFLEIPNLQVRKIKDPQFHSSIKYGISLAIAFIMLPLFLILFLVLVSPWWLGLLMFVLLPLSGLFAWNYYVMVKRISGGFRIRNLIASMNEEFISLRKDHRELLNMIASI